MKIMHADLQTEPYRHIRNRSHSSSFYLCATQAPHYVKRNFREIEKNQIHLDGAYLDVFTCNEGDECNNPRHRMTRSRSAMTSEQDALII